MPPDIPLVAVRHRLAAAGVEPLFVELPDGGRLLEITPAQALVLRVAEHVGTAGEIALRFADAARCPPERGRAQVELALEQGLLEPLGEATPWRALWQWPAGDWPLVACPDRDDSPSGTRIGDSDPPVSVPDGPVLVSRYLQGLQAERAVAGAAPEEPLAAVRRVLRRAPDDGMPVMLADAAYLRPLAADCHWLGVCLVDDPLFAAPGPVISDPGHATTGPGRRLLLAADLVQPPLTRFVAGAYGALLRYLYPRAKMLYLPARLDDGEAADSATTGECLRLALRALPDAGTATSPARRLRYLRLHLASLAGAEPAALQSALHSRWLEERGQWQHWAAVYGLATGPAHAPPHADPAQIAALQHGCREYLALLDSAALETGA